jgi:hypothetical protein
MVVKGLVHRGHRDLARKIAVRHLDAIIAVAENKDYDSIWECYSPEFMQPATDGYNKLSRRHFVGWTGLGPIAMLIEHILGYDFDASANQITWSIQTPGRHGIENLAFNGKTISLIVGEEDPIQKTRILTIETTGEINLAVSIGQEKSPSFKAFPSGRHEIIL